MVELMTVEFVRNSRVMQIWSLQEIAHVDEVRWAVVSVARTAALFDRAAAAVSCGRPRELMRSKYFDEYMAAKIAEHADLLGVRGVPVEDLGA